MVDKGRDQDDMSTNHGMPKITSQTLTARERYRSGSLTSSEGINTVVLVTHFMVQPWQLMQCRSQGCCKQ